MYDQRKKISRKKSKHVQDLESAIDLQVTPIYLTN